MNRRSSSPPTDYDSDILLWSEQQAALLRRLAAGEPVAVDWENIIEEIESVGREQWHAVESLLIQALRHMLKAEAWPEHRDAPGWRADAIDFRQQAQRRFSPSMRQRLDIEKLYQQALRAIPHTLALAGAALIFAWLLRPAAGMPYHHTLLLADNQVQPPYSCRLYYNEQRKCAFGSCDRRTLDRLKNECLRDGGRP